MSHSPSSPQDAIAEKMQQAVEWSRVEALAAAEAKLQRPLTAEEQQGIRRITSLQMLESICRAFSAPVTTAEEVARDLASFAASSPMNAASVSNPQEPRIPTFLKTSRIPAPARFVFAWHQSPGALTALIPPWEPVTVEQPAKTLGNGDIAILVMRMGPLKLRWVAQHSNLIDLGDLGGEFTDTQLKGPFARWVHRHVVRADGPNACILEDRIEYALPLGFLGQFFAGWHVRRKLQKMFDYRHDATRRAVCGEQAGAAA